MKKNKYNIILIIVFLCFIVDGCSVTKNEHRVDLVVKSTESEYWQSLYKGATAAADKYGIELTFSGPKEEADYKEQVKIFNNRLASKPDAIILAAGDYYMMSEPVHKAEIPVLLVDSLVKEDNVVSLITTDNYNVGIALAKEVMNRYGKEGKVGVISYVKNTSTAMDREKGFVDTIISESNLELYDTLYCEANIDQAMRQTISFLNKNSDIDIMVGLNAQSTIGIARAVEKLNEKNKNLFVVGVDCVVEEADFIEKGIIQVCILQNPYMMGYYSVENAYKIMEGKKVDKEVYVDTYIVDKNSLFNKEIQELIFPFN